MHAIEVHIEELVLHGFSGHNTYEVGGAVEREITRLLQEQGLPAGFSVAANVGRLHAGSFPLQADAKAAAVGNHIAKAVYQGLTK
jgi:hypothetical protein